MKTLRLVLSIILAFAVAVFFGWLVGAAGGPRWASVGVGSVIGWSTYLALVIVIKIDEGQAT